MVTLENTTKIVKSNEKKNGRNHKRCIAYFQMRLLNRHSKKGLNQTSDV